MRTRPGALAAVWRGTLRGALIAPLAVLAMVVPAHAEVANHPFIGTLIGGLEAGPKPLRPKLEAPCGVAVDAAGSIFVSDYGRKSVVGGPTLELFPGNGPCALASDGNNLYVNYWHGAVVNPESGVIDAGRSFGIAVDPATKNLYVSHGTSVSVYQAPVEPGNPPVAQIGSGGAIGDGFGVAVSDYPATEGDVYVADASNNTVKVFDPSVSTETPVKVIDGAGTAAGKFVSLEDSSLAIDQSNGHLFVVDNTQPGFEHPQAVVDEFNAEGIYRGQLDHAIVDGGPVGIAIDESETSNVGQIYVTSGNGSNLVIPPELGPPAAEQGALYAFGVAGAGELIEVSTSGPGQGSVTSEPAGIACPGACKAELNSGATVTLTANPAAGSAFAGWSGAAGCSSAPTCQVLLSAAAAVEAEFAAAPAPLLLSAAHTAATTGTSAGSAAPGPGATALLLGRLSPQKDGTVVLNATAPGPGTLTVSAKGLHRSHTQLAQAGALRIHLHLSKAGRRALANRKAGRLALRVAVSFEPSGSGAGSVISKTITFKQSSGGAR